MEKSNYNRSMKLTPIRPTTNNNPNSISVSPLGARGSTLEATQPKSETEGDTGKNEATKTTNNANSQSREQDLYLPTANVVRIMRKALPTNAKVGDDAKEMMQECVSEFISLCTSEANDACHKEYRRTITAEDLLGAMSRLGFDHYVGPLMTFLQNYRESEMLPTMIGPNMMNSPNTGPRVAGRNEFMPPANDGLPPFAVRAPTCAPPQYAMSGPAGNGLCYHNGPAQSSQYFVDATVHGRNGHSLCSGIQGAQSGAGDGGSGSYGPLHNGPGQSNQHFFDATIHGGNGHSLCSGIMGGQSAGDGGGGSYGPLHNEPGQISQHFFDASIHGGNGHSLCSGIMGGQSAGDGGGGSYGSLYNGPGQSSQYSIYATIQEGNGHSLCPGILGGQNAGDTGNGPSGNCFYYHNEPGQSSEHPVDATIHGGNGHSLCSGIMGGHSAGDGGSGPYGSLQGETEF